MSDKPFLVRADKKLHLSLKADASNQHISLNELCIDRLSNPNLLENFPADLIKAVAVLTRIAGNELQGVIVFGSWARGDQNQLSDIDVLVVMSSNAKISRNLYRRWEEEAPENNLVEPHFVLMPGASEKISGLMAEMAVDGLVVIDKNLELHRFLCKIRHGIATGKLIQKKTHGQNYWVHTEVE